MKVVLSISVSVKFEVIAAVDDSDPEPLDAIWE